MTNFYRNIKACGLALTLAFSAQAFAQTPSLSIDVSDITPTDAKVTVTPSDNDLKYYWTVTPKATFEANGGAEKAVENRIAVWTRNA